MARYAALITAGGTLSPELAALCGTGSKALAPLHGTPFIQHVIHALRTSGIVDVVGVVGCVAELQAAGVVAGVWADAGATAPENIRRGIVALQNAGYLAGDEPLLLCATDAVFLRGDTVCMLCRVAEESPDADIVFPVVRESDYRTQFPGSPNVFTPLASASVTGSSVQIVRPAAVVAALPYIERAFNARKSQWQMAKLLGAGFVCRFVTRTLTITDAAAKVAQITGLNINAPLFADARVAVDVDNVADYEYAHDYAAEEAFQKP